MVTTDQINKNFELLFNKIDIYYDQEQQYLSNKIKNNIETINSISFKKKQDFYNLTFLIEEIKYLTKYTFSDKLKSLQNRIAEIATQISNSNNIKDLINLTKHITFILKDYNDTLTQEFLEKQKDLNANLDQLYKAKIFNNNLYTKEDDLVKLYCKILNTIDAASIDNEYKLFFSALKSDVKKQDCLDSFLPLKDNKILSLLRLAYFLKNGKYKVSNLSQTDILLLKAFLASKQDITKLEKLNEYLDDLNPPTPLDIFFDKHSKSENIKKLKANINFNIFSISQLFNDFSIEEIFFSNKKNKLKTEIDSLATLVSKLSSDTIFCIEPYTLYSKLNTQRQIYKDCFLNTENTSPLETILENSPAKILNDVANKYFQNLLKIATIVNINISKNNISILTPFINFEDSFKELCDEVSKKSSLNIQKINYYLKCINKELPSINKNYKELSHKENNLINNYNESNYLCDFELLKVFLTNRDISSYKDYIFKNQKKSKDINIEKELKYINKNISKKRLDRAQNISKELTLKLLNQSYFNTPVLANIYSLPPVSNALLLKLENVSSNNIIDYLKNKQEDYWKA